MTRNRGKKALYEVMSKARVKPDQGRIVEHLRPRTPDKEAPSARQKGPVGASKSAAKWWKRPSIVQFNAGRFDFSLPYQVAVVLLLVFIFLIIAAYRLGQSNAPAVRQEPEQPEAVLQETDDQTPLERAMADVVPPSQLPGNTTADTEVAETRISTTPTTPTTPATPTGNNVIVLVQYHSLPDLAPVQQHFSEYGIETEVVPEGGSYFLQTKERYDNPDKPGTDGYIAKQKIIEVGAKYKGKAPAGYEPFAPRYFSDAYGKKVN